MNNRQKYLSVLAMMVQPMAPSYKAALKDTEEGFSKNLEQVGQLKPEEILEALVYALMALRQLSGMRKNHLFHDIVLDDVAGYLHDQTCQKCKDKNPESRCGRAAEDEVEDLGNLPRALRLEGPFSSLEEVMEAAFGYKKGKPS